MHQFNLGDCGRTSKTRPIAANRSITGAWRARIIAALAPLALAACTIVPPTNEGVALYAQGDFAAAYAELEPHADRNNRVGQYYIARMALEGSAPAPIAPENAINLLVESAGQGGDQAYALLLLLSMSKQELAYFKQSASSHAPLDSDHVKSLIPFNGADSRDVLGIDGDVVAFTERFAQGPVSPVAMASMLSLVDDLENWPAASQFAAPSEAQFLEIDRALAGDDDKYGQARLGNRYAAGRGVEMELRVAHNWRLKAAKMSPAPQHCINSISVENWGGGDSCVDDGEPTPGLALAMLEVCRAYATGEGVSRRTSRAQYWCEKAAEDPLYADEAEGILATISD